jgi:uncharacterized protein DUF6941
VRPDVVVLADAGHVRDGLLYVIGGGINQMYTPSLPGVVQATIIARLLLDEADYDKDHAMSVMLRRESADETVATIQGTFQTKRPRSTLIPPVFAAAIKLDGLVLPEYGAYTLDFEIDGQSMKQFPFELMKPEALRRRSTDRSGRGSSPDPTIRPKSRRRRG